MTVSINRNTSKKNIPDFVREIIDEEETDVVGIPAKFDASLIKTIKQIDNGLFMIEVPLSKDFRLINVE